VARHAGVQRIPVAARGAEGVYLNGIPGYFGNAIAREAITFHFATGLCATVASCPYSFYPRRVCRRTHPAASAISVARDIAAEGNFHPRRFAAGETLGLLEDSGPQIITHIWIPLANDGRDD
jgi:hypothetical protein